MKDIVKESLGAAQDRREAVRRELDAGRFMKIARERGGLSDFGDEGFVDPMRKLLDCAARDVDFHPHGLESLKSDVVRCLVNRLRMHDDLKRHPEILEEDVSDPIIVLGMGRSGTTKLQKMMSAADSVQKMLFWRMWNPARFPDATPGSPDPRIAAANFSDLMTEDKPDLDAAHHMEHGESDEDWLLYFYTFEDWGWCHTVPAFSYYDWVMPRPSLGTFRYVRTMLQYLQWQDGGSRGRPWVLKNVGYIANMDSLLACYPNATLVHPHRDPRKTVASYAKFLSSIWPIKSNPVDPVVTGRETLRWWREAMNRYLEARDRLKLNDRILDVKYEQVRTDPMTIIREVFQRAGRELNAAAEQQIAQWHDSNEQGRFGSHEYSLEEFGLSDAMIDEAFAEYIRRFIER